MGRDSTSSTNKLFFQCRVFIVKPSISDKNFSGQNLVSSNKLSSNKQKKQIEGASLAVTWQIKHLLVLSHLLTYLFDMFNQFWKLGLDWPSLKLCYLNPLLVHLILKSYFDFQIEEIFYLKLMFKNFSYFFGMGFFKYIKINTAN